MADDFGMGYALGADSGGNGGNGGGMPDFGGGQMPGNFGGGRG